MVATQQVKHSKKKVVAPIQEKQDQFIINPTNFTTEIYIFKIFQCTLIGFKIQNKLHCKQNGN
jgi:hypothetical protein